MEERKNNAIQALRQIIEESHRINIDSYENGKERTARWKERAIRIIRENVSENESEKFKKTTYRPTHLSNDAIDYILEEIELYQGRIQILIEELTEFPESILDPINFTSKDKWDFYFKELHPAIQYVSKKRFSDGHYADSVEAALKELNFKIKEIYREKKSVELDGKNLMMNAFSESSPVIVLDDLSNDTGKSIQEGYKFLYAGAMLGIRNPKAHANVNIDSRRAMHHLFLASLLWNAPLNL